MPSNGKKKKSAKVAIELKAKNEEKLENAVAPAKKTTQCSNKSKSSAQNVKLSSKNSKKSQKSKKKSQKSKKKSQKSKKTQNKSENAEKNLQVSNHSNNSRPKNSSNKAKNPKTAAKSSKKVTGKSEKNSKKSKKSGKLTKTKKPKTTANISSQKHSGKSKSKSKKSKKTGKQILSQNTSTENVSNPSDNCVSSKVKSEKTETKGKTKKPKVSETAPDIFDTSENLKNYENNSRKASLNKTNEKKTKNPKALEDSQNSQRTLKIKTKDSNKVIGPKEKKNLKRPADDSNFDSRIIKGEVKSERECTKRNANTREDAETENTNRKRVKKIKVEVKSERECTKRNASTREYAETENANRKRPTIENKPTKATIIQMPSRHSQPFAQPQSTIAQVIRETATSKTVTSKTATSKTATSKTTSSKTATSKTATSKTTTSETNAFKTAPTKNTTPKAAKATVLRIPPRNQQPIAHLQTTVTESTIKTAIKKTAKPKAALKTVQAKPTASSFTPKAADVQRKEVPSSSIEKKNRVLSEEDKLRHHDLLMVWKFTKAYSDNLKKMGVVYNTGRFSKTETEIVQRNIARFEKNENIDARSVIDIKKKDNNSYRSFYKECSIGIMRPLPQVKNFVQRMYASHSKSSKFTPEEDEMLYSEYAKNPDSWVEIAAALDRTYHSVQKRYVYLEEKKKNLKGGSWSKDEDDILRKAVNECKSEESKSVCWLDVANMVGTRSKTQCYRRWNYYLKNRQGHTFATKEQTYLKLQLIYQKLLELGVKDESEINWTKVSDDLQIDSGKLLKQCFDKFRRDSLGKISLPDYLEAAMNDT